MNLNRFCDRIQSRICRRSAIPFELRFWTGEARVFGDGPPALEITINDRRGLAALASLDELAISNAYLAGSLDINGDMLRLIDLRSALPDKDRWWNQFARRLTALILGQVQVDRRAISRHYEFDHELYLSYLRATRCYSQAVYEHDGESLDDAQRRKLDLVLEACRLAPGHRVLDVGGGWGTLTEHAGRKGIRVTSLTISRKSHEFITDLIACEHLPCQVLLQDFLEHEAAQPYDAIAILGVMEHLPDYPAVLRQLTRLLRPGGRVYLDAGAITKKFKATPFLTSYIFPGNHSFFCLHNFMQALAATRFELIALANDRHSYYLTCKAWAENLELARERIVARWGEPIYRRFRLFLWGSAHAFLSRGLSAYRVVLELPQLS